MKQKRPLEKKLKFKKLKKKKKKKKKNQPKFFLFYFSKLTPKRCPGGRRLHPQRPQRVFEEDEAEEATKKSSSKCCSGYTYFVQLNWLWKVEFLSQPISKYRNRTTTLIPFLQAINHFCTFIHSYFMDRFAFLIEGTSYVVTLLKYLNIMFWC